MDPIYGRAKSGPPTRTCIQQLCEDTGCSPENMTEVINDREKWRERVRDIRASSTTWLLWWWYIYIYKGATLFKGKFLYRPTLFVVNFLYRPTFSIGNSLYWPTVFIGNSGGNFLYRPILFIGNSFYRQLSFYRQRNDVLDEKVT